MPSFSNIIHHAVCNDYKCSHRFTCMETHFCLCDGKKNELNHHETLFQNNNVICQNDSVFQEMGFHNHWKFSLRNDNYFIFQMIIFHLNKFWNTNSSLTKNFPDNNLQLFLASLSTWHPTTQTTHIRYCEKANRKSGKKCVYVCMCVSVCVRALQRICSWTKQRFKNKGLAFMSAVSFDLLGAPTFLSRHE